MPNTIVPAIQQRLRADADSICFKCFHRKVCRAIDNQPCIECNQFTDVNGVTVQQWIPVSERLPEKYGKYLCRYVFGGSAEYPHMEAISYYPTMTRFQGEGSCGMRVTHWMPLPEPPKGE